MTLRAAHLLVLLPLVVACDSASTYENCKKPDKEGSGEERCVPSTFPQEDPLGRQALGYVSQGSEHLSNAIVNVNGTLTTTDEGGFYHQADAPFVYDASAIIGSDVIAFHQAAVRFLDLAVEQEGPPRAYEAIVHLKLDGLPRPGNALAFFASGENIAGVKGTSPDALRVLTRTFENDKATIHVVEYPKDVGLAGAVAKGSVTMTVRTDTTMTAPVLMLPLAERKSTTFTVKPDPSGFEPEDVELTLDFGIPLERVVVAKLKSGDKVDLPVMRSASWLATAKAKRSDGATASIGRRGVSPGDSIDITFFAPPAAQKNEGDLLVATSAQGTGVFEHVLVPTDPTNGGGKTIHVFSTDYETKLPDLRPLGIPPLHGEYRWTVRVFPDFAVVDAMSGTLNRLYRASSAAAPRTIVLP